MLFLTPDEVLQLAGYSQKSRQKRALTRNAGRVGTWPKCHRPAFARQPEPEKSLSTKQEGDDNHAVAT